MRRAHLEAFFEGLMTTQAKPVASILQQRSEVTCVRIVAVEASPLFNRSMLLRVSGRIHDGLVAIST